MVVVTQKIVSKAEGRLVPIDPDDPEPGPAHRGGVGARPAPPRRTRHHRDPPRLRLRQRRASTSPTSSRGWAALLPEDSDRSARRIRDGLRAGTGVEVGVIVSDTFGRPWRQGVIDVAIGCAGVAAVVDLRGTADALGRELQATEVCVADEIASAAELVMGKALGYPGGRRPRRRPRPGCAAGRWPTRSSGRRPRTSSAEAPTPSRPRLTGDRDCRQGPRWRRRTWSRTDGQPRGGASVQAATQVDRRPVRGRGRCAGSRRGGPGRSTGGPCWLRPRSAMTRASSLTDTSRPGPDVEHETTAPGRGPDEGVDHVVDEDEVTRLLPVAEDRDRLRPRRSRSAKMATTPASPWGSWRGP